MKIKYIFFIKMTIKKVGSGALSGRMMLVRIVENNNNDAYFRAGLG